MKPTWIRESSPPGVPSSGQYVGHFADKSRDTVDVWLDGSLVYFVYGVGPHDFVTNPLSHSLTYQGEWEKMAAPLLRAHQSRAAKPPVLSREQMIEAVAADLAGFQSADEWPHEWSSDSQAEVRRRAIHIVDKLRPELKPAPEPVKSEGTVIAEKLVMPFDTARDARRTISSAIDAALAARDEQHRRELEALRDRCVKAMTGQAFPYAANIIREVPLTEPTAEAR